MAIHFFKDGGLIRLEYITHVLRRSGEHGRYNVHVGDKTIVIDQNEYDGLISDLHAADSNKETLKNIEIND